MDNFPYILPCPCCGNDAQKSSYDPYDGYQGNCTVYRVKCKKCGLRVEGNTLEECIKKWNARVSKLNIATPYSKIDRGNIPTIAAYTNIIADDQNPVMLAMQALMKAIDDRGKGDE